jgi:hypothetical protein
MQVVLALGIIVGFVFPKFAAQVLKARFVTRQGSECLCGYYRLEMLYTQAIEQRQKHVTGMRPVSAGVIVRLHR